MPRYDYLCGQCGHAFELRQSFSSEPVANCPECAGGATRQFHAPPVFFKGSGWYVNDYGKGRNNGAAADKDKKEATASDSEDKAPAKAKPAAKPEKESSSNATKSD